MTAAYLVSACHIKFFLMLNEFLRQKLAFNMQFATPRVGLIDVVRALCLRHFDSLDHLDTALQVDLVKYPHVCP